MRTKAKKKKMLLNQKGLFYRDTGKQIKKLKTEQDYFKVLELDYKTPEER